MKKAIILLILAALAALPALALSQIRPDDSDSQHQERYTRLQAMRVWIIIDTLNLDASSERGLAILAAIKEFSDQHQLLMIQRHALYEELRQMRTAQTQPSEETVASVAAQWRQNQKDFLELQLAELERMNELLTPAEQLKMIEAEETFRRQLRSAMSGRSGGQRRGPR